MLDLENASTAEVLIEGPTARFHVVEDRGDGNYVCAVIFPATQEVREQVVHLDEGRRPGHCLWRERVERRLVQYADDHERLIPYHLVR